MSSAWKSVTRQDPCTNCGKPDWCRRSQDGAFMICHRLDNGDAIQRTNQNGDIYYLYPTDPNKAYSPISYPPLPPPAERAAADVLVKVYRAFLCELSLNQRHRQELTERGLSSEAIERNGFKSMVGKGRSALALKLEEQFSRETLLKTPGFHLKGDGGKQWISIAGQAGLFIPVLDYEGRIVGIMIRPDKPGDGGKYVWLSSTRYDGPGPGSPVPLACVGAANASGGPVRLVEGILKAIVTNEIGDIPAIGLPGANLPDSLIPILQGMDPSEVRLDFDGDAANNQHVARGLRNAVLKLDEASLVIALESWPESHGKGLDDVLNNGHTPKALRGQTFRRRLNEIMQSAQVPTEQPPAPVNVEILHHAPSILSKPLALVDGKSYAATWVWTQTTRTEFVGKKGQVIKHDIPEVTTERQIRIVSGDGKLFTVLQLEAKGIEITLGEKPQDNKLFSFAGVESYIKGERPDYVDIFSRLNQIYDYYIDFSQSFADQESMCALAACQSLMTWFADAFTLISYPWFNGERGSGKTQAGNVWANTSYLGLVLLSSGSFAALRDLADYGAAMLFDDAENLTDPRKSDPDKREMALAGNRKGVQIPFKVPSPTGRGWNTRWVNAYAPRAFTSIKQPDPTMLSRTIRTPLVRTSDPTRANRDPGDLERWPHNWRHLQDDLWATGLALLQEAKEVWNELDNETGIMGREFEPWRPIIAVARLFERHGVSGLEAKMREVMGKYQSEKADVNVTDRPVQVLRTIYKMETGLDPLDLSDVSDVMNVSDVSFESKTEIQVEAKKLAEQIQVFGKEFEFDIEWVNSRSVGRQLAILRFTPGRNLTSKKRERYRLMSVGNFLSLCVAYGLIKPLALSPKETSETFITSETSGNSVYSAMDEELENVGRFSGPKETSDVDGVEVGSEIKPPIEVGEPLIVIPTGAHADCNRCAALTSGICSQHAAEAAEDLP